MVYNKNMPVSRRKSLYADEVMRIVRAQGHATNQEIARILRKHFPAVSDTTVHRVTQRLFDDGMLAKAPMTCAGCLRYDSNLNPHDHFECRFCGGIRDIIVSPAVRHDIEQALGGCHITGQLTIQGNCQSCLDDLNKKEDKNGII